MMRVTVEDQLDGLGFRVQVLTVVHCRCSSTVVLCYMGGTPS